MGIRSFIAIKVPDLITPQVVKLQNSLKEAPVKVRWVEPQNLHFTLHFLGDTDPQEIPDIVKKIKEEVGIFAPFSLNLAGVGAFPREGKVKVVWAGVGRGRQEMQKLQPLVLKGLEKAGIDIGENRFHPHLTLGRVKNKSNTRPLRLLMEKERGFSSSDFSVSSIQLMKSQLTPEGPIYTVLEEICLRGETLDN